MTADFSCAVETGQIKQTRLSLAQFPVWAQMPWHRP